MWYVALIYAASILIRIIAFQWLTNDTPRITYGEYKALQAIAPEKWKVPSYNECDEWWSIKYREDETCLWFRASTLSAKNWFHWKLIKLYSYKIEKRRIENKVSKQKADLIKSFKKDLENFKER